MRPMITCSLALALLAASVAVPGSEAAAITDCPLIHRGTERSYVLYVPEEVPEDPPVLVLLHGSGRDGRSLVRKWSKTADAEGIVLVAPNAKNPAQWSPYDDAPSFLRAVLADVAENVRYDRRRVYLFGHSGGAVWALQVGLLASHEYAAAAAHAGRIPDEALALIDQAERKTPFSIQVGSRDPFFPTEDVERTVDALRDAGFPVEYSVISGHDHDYYSKAKKINHAAWEFLHGHSLPEPGT